MELVGDDVLLASEFIGGHGRIAVALAPRMVFGGQLLAVALAHPIKGGLQIGDVAKGDDLALAVVHANEINLVLAFAQSVAFVADPEITAILFGLLPDETTAAGVTDVKASRCHD